MDAALPRAWRLPTRAAAGTTNHTSDLGYRRYSDVDAPLDRGATHAAFRHSRYRRIGDAQLRTRQAPLAHGLSRARQTGGGAFRSNLREYSPGKDGSTRNCGLHCGSECEMMRHRLRTPAEGCRRGTSVELATIHARRILEAIYAKGQARK